MALIPHLDDVPEERPEGLEVHAGDRFGVMKFGSRMDIFIPATAQVAVKVNDKVVGGVTVIARLVGRTARPYTG